MEVRKQRQSHFEWLMNEVHALILSGSHAQGHIQTVNEVVNGYLKQTGVQIAIICPHMSF